MHISPNHIHIVHHSIDETDMIRRKPERTDSKTDKGPIDAFIYQNDSARQITWQQRVDEAVKGENDEFWRKVTKIKWCVCICLIQLDSRKNSTARSKPN